MLRLATPDYLRFCQSDKLNATFGGGEANVAVSLANYGIATEFVTRLPKNDIARACVMDLRKYGVGTSHIVYGGDRLGIYFLETGAVARASKVVYDRAHSAISEIQPGMVNWAKENAVSSGLKDAPIRWLVDDCVKFVEREIRRGNTYDAIIMDPPSYGRGPKGEIWKIEDAIHPLVKLCTKILSDNPLFFLINSYTTGLAPAVLTYMLATELKNFHGTVESSEIGLPVSESGLVLPCGASGRWEAI